MVFIVYRISYSRVACNTTSSRLFVAIDFIDNDNICTYRGKFSIYTFSSNDISTIQQHLT